MGKDFKKRNQHHKNKKPYNQNFKNKSGNRSNYVANTDIKFKPRNQGKELRDNLMEIQVGITEYTTNNKGFTGVVKARFSDFHVNEIDPNGKVLQLDDLAIPQQIDDELDEKELTSAKKELDEVISTELWSKIEALSKLKSSDPTALPIEIEVTDMSKEKRTQIHKVLKKLYVGKLVSTTENKESTDLDDKNVEEKKIIKILKPKGSHDQNRNRWTFPGEYVRFLVHKENMDTSEVAVIIANRLNLRPSQVNYSGTKDKRAKTTQKFCIKRRTPSQIISSIKNNNSVHIGNFEFSNEVLKLGDLKGNRFRIALRHVSADDAEIEAALQNIKNTGFINYYGLQRFGNCAAIPTYEIGIAILKCNYKLACELILKPRENDLHFLRAIREKWWKNRNSAEASAMFHSDKFIEKKLLDGLAQYGENDYASALRKLPRNMLLLYPHAFQSFIFNRIASRRIKEFGLQLMLGDLVYRNKDEQDNNPIELATMATTEADESEIAHEETETVDATKDSIFKLKVKALTAEDIASDEYTLFDVVLPLPGYDITLPDNEVGKWYEELLQEHELSLEKLKHNVKTYAMAGAYRKLLVKPEQMTWEFRKYDTPESTLIASDWELLRSKKIDIEDTGKFKALIVDFCLPTAGYATMFLRELLKTDTSAASQAQLEQTELKKLEKEEDVSKLKQDAEDTEAGETINKTAETLEVVEKIKTKDENEKDVIVNEAKRARLDEANEEP